MTWLAEEEHAPALQKQQASLRLGFVGVGWIGRRRMKALLEHGGVEAVAMAEPAAEAADAARELAPGVHLYEDLDGLLGGEALDGVVIASPSALHAEQAIRALDAGLPVFCQKPMGRTAAEAHRVVEAARRADRLLAVDMSYRFTEAMQAIRRRVQAGAIGTVYAVDLTFHNAYGPDKAWFYDPVRAGGGCVVDLGIHLIDLALWTLDVSAVDAVTSRLFAEGRPLAAPAEQVEDYAVARLDLGDGTAARLACSWNLPAGRDAVIEAAFYGTEGGLAMHNVDGSFVDFRAARYDGTARRVLAEPPDAWGGRAAIAWAERLAERPCFDAGVEQYLHVAAAIDAIYDPSLAFTQTHTQTQQRPMAEQQSKTTTDPDTIRQWAEARGGVPATIRQTESGEEPGMLRIHFPDGDGGEESFEEIDWEAFFGKFEENDLAFLYQEETDEGRPSRFFKFVRRT